MTRAQYDQLRKKFFRNGGRLKGKVVRRIENGGGQILEPGAEVTIRDKGGGLTIETEICKHCKQRGYFRGVYHEAVMLLEPIP